MSTWKLEETPKTHFTLSSKFHMPISQTPTKLSKYLDDHRLAVASPETRLRYALADHAEGRDQPLVNPRRTTLRFLRFQGHIPPGGRWTRTTHGQIQSLLGRAALWLHHDIPMLRTDFVHRLRLMGDDEERRRHEIETEQMRRNAQTRVEVESDARNEGKLLERAIQRSRRHAFGDWLIVRRRGPCSPKRAYRQWRGEAQENPFTGRFTEGLKPGQHTKHDALSTLGQMAAQLILDDQPIDRLALADKLKEI